jgi:hypothetical protein
MGDGSQLAFLARLPLLTRVFVAHETKIEFLNHLTAIPQICSINDLRDGVANLARLDVGDGSELAVLAELPVFTRVYLPDRFPLSCLQHLAACTKLSRINHIDEGIADLRHGDFAACESPEEVHAAAASLARMLLIDHVVLPADISEEHRRMFEAARDDWQVTLARERHW